MEHLSFKVAEVEGPLDLILQLIAKHKLDIFDIDISELLKQYLAKIQEWQEQNMEVASEFLQMASRLVYIKSLSLLPRQEELEELKKELTGQLIEYSVCKQVSLLLREMCTGMDIVVKPPEKMPPEMLLYSRSHTVDELLQAYKGVAGKNVRRLPPPAETFEPLVTRRVVSVGSKLTLILNRLYKHKKLRFAAIYKEGGSRSDLVASFLAILELVKDKRAMAVRENGEDVLLSSMKTDDEWKRPMEITSEEGEDA